MCTLCLSNHLRRELRHLGKSSQQVFLYVMLVLSQLLTLVATLHDLVVLSGHLLVVEMAIVQLLNQCVDLNATVINTLQLLTVTSEDVGF